MPYESLECYVKYTEESFPSCLRAYRSFLRDMGFSEPYLAQHVDTVEWELAENHFMYTGCGMPHEHREWGSKSFYVRPLVTGFSHKVFEGQLFDDWLTFELLFNEDEVKDTRGTNHMNEASKALLLKVCTLMAKAFPDEAMFLSGESVGLQPFEAMCGINKNRYEFDLAVIPENYIGYFADMPLSFRSSKVGNNTWFANMDIWACIPWEK